MSMSGSRSCITDRRRLRSIVMGGVLAAAGTVLLSGCYTVKDTTAAIPEDYRRRHPITIKETDRTVEVFVGTNRGGLNASQRADVLAFAHAWKKEATGGIIIDQPAGTSNGQAADEAAHEARAILAAAGVPPSAIAVRPYRPQNRVALATVRLNYPKVSAEAGPCGLWPADLGPTYEAGHFENKPYWNLGCSMQRNLAAMVDNPADLVQPRGESPSYAPRRAAVLDKYRKGESTATNYPNATQGKISDIGK
jgi:pilus assembly protein CpaD